MLINAIDKGPEQHTLLACVLMVYPDLHLSKYLNIDTTTYCISQQ